MAHRVLTIRIFALIYAIILRSHISDAEVCKVSGNELQFYKNDESFIIKCIVDFPQTIRTIKIDSCNLKTFENVESAKTTFAGLETLSIVNSRLERVSFSRVYFPDLKYLNLAGNNLKVFQTWYKSGLISLNVSNNKLSDVVLDQASLKELDLSNNLLDTFDINLMGPRFINMSRSFASRPSRPKQQVQKITIWQTVDFMDLSQNNLVDIQFLQLYSSLKSLSLDKNSFTNLSQLILLPSKAKISLEANPIECSTKLTLDWLTLLNHEIVFANDLRCYFSRNGNKYSVKTHGLAFNNENDIYNAEWIVTRSNTYARFSSMKVWMVAFQDKLRLGWSSINQSFDNVLILKSQKDEELYRSNASFGKNGTFVDIHFSMMSDVTSACLLTRVYNLTSKGRELVDIPVHCQNTTLVDSGTRPLRISLIMVILLFVLYFITSMCIVGYVYYFKLRRSVQPQSDVIELQTYVANQSKPTISSEPPEYQSSYVVNSHKSITNSKEYYLGSIGNGSIYPIMENHLYLDMEPQDPYLALGSEHTYDRVNSRACGTISPDTSQIINNNNKVEDVYEFR